jgi:N utilization substance protein B
MTTRSPNRSSRSVARSSARLAAVQALYQWQMEATHLPRLLDEFHQHRLGGEVEGTQLAPAEVAFFDDIVSGAIARIAEIDELVSSKLAKGWALDRLDRTMKQILRAGTYELLARADVPVGTVISEYVDVAHAFFDEREAKFVNGVLDAVAKTVRT